MSTRILPVLRSPWYWSSNQLRSLDLKTLVFLQKLHVPLQILSKSYEAEKIHSHRCWSSRKYDRRRTNIEYISFSKQHGIRGVKCAEWLVHCGWPAVVIWDIWEGWSWGAPVWSCGPVPVRSSSAPLTNSGSPGKTPLTNHTPFLKFTAAARRSRRALGQLGNKTPRAVGQPTGGTASRLEEPRELTALAAAQKLPRAQT